LYFSNWAVADIVESFRGVQAEFGSSEEVTILSLSLFVRPFFPSSYLATMPLAELIGKLGHRPWLHAFSAFTAVRVFRSISHLHYWVHIVLHIQHDDRFLEQYW
jgi:hypothetical protein